MTEFSYIALDAGGREQHGRIDATDAGEATQRLRAQSLFIVNINEGKAVSQSSGGIKTGSFFKLFSLKRFLPVSDRDRSFFLRQMALMLRSGYTIVQALDVSSELSERPRFSKIIDRMSQSIRGGASFSSAIAVEKKTFPSLEAKLISSGEHSGDLAPVLERLSEDLIRRREVRRQFMLAMIYPGFLITVGSGVIYFLVASVIPKFATFLTSRGKNLPPLTQFMLDASDWLINYGPTIFGGLGIFIFILLNLYTTAVGKRKIDRVLLLVPIYGKTAIYAGMAQAGWTMGMLLRSGVTVLDGLRMTGSTMDNQTIADVFEKSADEILSGRSLANAFKQPVLPLLIQHMAAVGERSGQLEQVMEESGEFYRKELTARIKTLSEWIVPVAVLIIAIPVGVVYIAFFTALLSISAR